MLRNISFFQRIQQREITGKMYYPQGVQKEKQARELINQYKKAEKIEERILLLGQLKDLVLLNVKPAVDFYNNIYTYSFTLFEMNEVVNSAFKEIGYFNTNPKFLCNLFYRLWCLHGDGLPNIMEGFNCLVDATKMHDKQAVVASYILAYLYSAELGHNFKNVRPLGLGSLEFFYIQFIKKLEGLNINVVKLRLDGEIAFANLGCASAISNLIKWYSNGNEILHIEPDLDKAKELSLRLSTLEDFLQKKYCEYYDIALQNTKKFGYIHVGTPDVEFTYFLKVWGVIKFGADYQKALPIVKEEFIQEAMSGSIGSCLLLAYQALNDQDLSDAKKWFNKILEINGGEWVNPLEEAVIASRECYEIAIKQKVSVEDQHVLLEESARLGCVKSLLELGEQKLIQANLKEAKKYFNSALAHSSSTSVPYTICNSIIEFMHKGWVGLEPYYFATKGEEIKRGSRSGIIEMFSLANRIDDEELATSWSEIELNLSNSLIEPETIDELIKKTQDSCNRYYENDVEPTTQFKM
jgi:hypothetical protein